MGANQTANGKEKSQKFIFQCKLDEASPMVQFQAWLVANGKVEKDSTH